MKQVVFGFLFSALLTPAFANDFSDLDGPLMTRVTNGCQMYAEKQARKHLEEHFNMNSWAGGSISAGSVQSAREALPSHVSFLQSQCENMVAEVLQMKLGYAPWQ